MAEMGESDLALEDHRIAAVRFRPMPSAQVVAKPRISIDRRYVYPKSRAFLKPVALSEFAEVIDGERRDVLRRPPVPRNSIG